MRKTFSNYLKKLLKSDSKYALLLGDISVGLFVDENEKLPSRVYNLGILEQSMISFASGLSRGGITPFVHTISPFLIERAYEQIKLDISYNQCKVIMVSANGPYDYNKLGPTHHCASDVPLIDLLKNIKIFLPSRTKDISKCIDKALKSSQSSYIRLTSFASENNKIKEKVIQSRKKDKTELNIIIGESLYHLEKKLGKFKNWIYIYDLDFNNFKIFEKFDTLIFWEPYSKPILAIKFKNKKINHRSKLISYTYPPYIYNGIYKKPLFIKNYL